MKSEITIEHVWTREVIDSKGKPTMEVEVTTSVGETGRAMIPSELISMENDITNTKESNIKKIDVESMLKNKEKINDFLNQELIGMKVTDQIAVDGYMKYLKESSFFEHLNSNNIFGISMATARAGAKSLEIPLHQYIGGVSGSTIPYPMMTVFYGGKEKSNNINIKEFMIVPKDVSLFSDRLNMCTEVYGAFNNLLKEKCIHQTKNEEGVFLKSDIVILDMLMSAIKELGYENHFYLSLNIMADEMYHDGKYFLSKSNDELTTDELIDFYINITKEYPILSIEDALASKDMVGWKRLTKELGDKVYLVGNHLFLHNKEKFMEGVKNKIANSIVIKPNQIGTVTKTIDMIKFAKSNQYMPIISSSVGETEDSFIAELAVALNVKYMKCGAPVGSENTAKYNQLLRIEESILHD